MHDIEVSTGDFNVRAGYEIIPTLNQEKHAWRNVETYKQYKNDLNLAYNTKKRGTRIK